MFGIWLKKRRKQLDLTQLELANLVNCSLETIRKIESGDRRPSKQIAELLSKYLKISPQDERQFVSAARKGLFPTLEQQAAPHIPSLLASFVGRTQELAELEHQIMIKHVRLMTIVGSPGVGKTRLAIQLGWQLASQFQNNVWFVSLAELTEPNQVLVTIAQILNQQADADESLVLRLSRFLQEKAAFIILDNFEHVLDAAIDIYTLLENVPTLKVLVTSREHLNIYGEQIFRLNPFDVPVISASSNLDYISNTPAIKLFLDRASAIDNSLHFDLERILSVVEICRRVDGLPLTIELAAAQLYSMSVEDIVARLSSRLETLVGGPRNFPVRLQTLRASIDWSFKSLREHLQHLISCLVVFPGSFSLEAALEISSFGKLDVEELQKKNLIQLVVVNDSTRYLILESIREYIFENSIQTGSLVYYHQRHAQYFANFAFDIAGDNNYHSVTSFQLIAAEMHNLEAALNWCYIGDTQIGLGILGAIWRYWYQTGELETGIRWIEQFKLKVVRDSIQYAYALYGLGVLYLRQQKVKPAIDNLQHSSQVFDKFGNGDYVGAALQRLSDLNYRLGNLELAEMQARQALTLFEQESDLLAISWALNGLALIVHDRGENGALNFLQRSIDIARRLGDPRHLAWMLTNAGVGIHFENEHYEEGKHHLIEAYQLFQEAADLPGIVYCDLYFVRLELMVAQTPVSEVRKRLISLLQLAHETTTYWSHCLCLLAFVEFRSDNSDTGVMVIGALPKDKDTEMETLYKRLFTRKEAILYTAEYTKAKASMSSGQFKELLYHGKSIGIMKLYELDRGPQIDLS